MWFTFREYSVIILNYNSFVLFTVDRFRSFLKTSTNANTDYINAVVVAVNLSFSFVLFFKKMDGC